MQIAVNCAKLKTGTDDRRETRLVPVCQNLQDLSGTCALSRVPPTPPDKSSQRDGAMTKPDIAQTDARGLWAADLSAVGECFHCQRINTDRSPT